MGEWNMFLLAAHRLNQVHTFFPTHRRAMNNCLSIQKSRSRLPEPASNMPQLGSCCPFVVDGNFKEERVTSNKNHHPTSSWPLGCATATVVQWEWGRAILPHAMALQGLRAGGVLFTGVLASVVPLVNPINTSLPAVRVLSVSALPMG